MESAASVLHLLTSALLASHGGSRDLPFGPAYDCHHRSLHNQLELAKLFYSMRSYHDEVKPWHFEDAILAYPEEAAASRLIIEDKDTFIAFCPETVALEMLLSAERHLSLLARTTHAAHLKGNASAACLRAAQYQALLESSIERFGEVPWIDPFAELLHVGTFHLLRTWHRLGIQPERFCQALEVQADDDDLLPVELADVGVHYRCSLRKLEGFDGRSGDASKGCHTPSFVIESLPSVAREAMALRLPLSSSSSIGCGKRFATVADPVSEDWRLDGSGMHARSCRVPFLTYFPTPIHTITICKYCSVASYLNLRVGDRLLEFGSGCGIGATWLAASFGLRVTLVDAFDEHLRGAREKFENLNVELEATCRGGVSALEAFPDSHFDAIISNSAMSVKLSLAEQCAMVHAQLLRLLKKGGVLWLGDLNNPHHTNASRGNESQWRNCLKPLAEAERVAYGFVAELESFGVTESMDERAISLMVVRLDGPEADAGGAAGSREAEEVDAETHRQASLYGCEAAVAEGYLPPVTTLPSFHDADTSFTAFAPGPSFWACAEKRLEKAWDGAVGPKKLAPDLWALEGFATISEVDHVYQLVEGWFASATKESTPEIDDLHVAHRDLWVDDLIAPSGVDAVLDMLEVKLEAWGIPRAHSDPWHILRYQPGYSARWEHTDCDVPGIDPENDRRVTALIWISPCWNTSGDCTPDHTLEDVDDGTTVFPNYGMRVRMPAGSLVLYNSYQRGPDGTCNQAALHYASSLSAAAPGPKVLLQKWYYAKPVEPSAPELPAARCDEGGARAQCKRWMAAPEALGSQRVQNSLADFQRLTATSTIADPMEQVVSLVMSREVAALREALELQVTSSSLGQSPHWYSMHVLSEMELIAWQLGIGGDDVRSRALERLRGAVRRCPSCEEPLQLLARTLAEGVPASEVSDSSEMHRDALEALAYVRRLALMGRGSAARLSQRLSSVVDTVS